MFALFASLLSLCSKRAGLLYGTILGLLVTALLVLAVRFVPHVTARYEAWRDPATAAQTTVVDTDSDEVRGNKMRLQRAGKHLEKAFDAIENGGIAGTGLRFGIKRYDVPYVWNDSIYVGIVEELGLLGGIHVAVAVLVLAIESARIARRLPEGWFERNMVLGSGCMTCVQAFIIMGGITGAIPLTGVTLPFVSTGGSSILSCCMLVGLMGACSSKSQQRTANSFSISTALVPIAICASMVWCVSCIVCLQPTVRFCGDTSADYKASDVYTSDGVALATGGSVYSGTKDREYPQSTLAAHALGQVSNGLDAQLCAPKARTNINPFLNALALDQEAEDTVLTLDSSVQLEAENQLAGEVGAIVAMDTRSGAVLAEASSPTYDPTAEYDPNSSDGVYFNRAVDALYAPGSTFKVVTLAAALEAGEATLDNEYTSKPFNLGEGTITNLYYPESDKVTLREALALSTNTAFAQLALQMGERPIANMAETLGFNQGIADPALDASTPTYEANDSNSEFAFAWAAVGQTMSGHGASTSVLQMCRVMAAIANGGMTVQPYLVESGPLASPRSEPTRAMSEETASTVWDAMVEASGIELEGMEVAGKTGTAENGDHGVLCWYICSSGDVAVACCVERESGTGGDNAMPLAKEVLKTAVACAA
jgi:peptidoglycan glycosyltransferase